MSEKFWYPFSEILAASTGSLNADCDKQFGSERKKGLGKMYFEFIVYLKKIYGHLWFQSM